MHAYRMQLVKAADLDKWDARFLHLASVVAEWSKDPSTQCGAVIIDSLRRVRGIGYNGFPRGVTDSEDRLADRELKYAMIVHAEANAILNSGGDLTGCRIYVHPFPSCSDCAKLVIQSGITSVVSWDWPSKHIIQRWGSSVDVSVKMFKEAGIHLLLAQK